MSGTGKVEVDAPSIKGGRLIILDNGNVGMSVTSPSEKLEVNGNVKATSFIKSGGTYTQFLMADGSVNTSFDTATLSENIDYNTLVYERDTVIKTQAFHIPNYSNHVNYPEHDFGQLLTFGGFSGLFPAQIAMMNSGNMYYRVKYNPNLQNFDFNNTPWNQIVHTSGGTSNFIAKFSSGGAINSSSIIYDNGTNVGIGTTTPSEKLEVNGNVKANSFIKSGGTSTQILMADGSVKEQSTIMVS